MDGIFCIKGYYTNLFSYWAGIERDNAHLCFWSSLARANGDIFRRDCILSYFCPRIPPALTHWIRFHVIRFLVLPERVVFLLVNVCKDG